MLPRRTTRYSVALLLAVCVAKATAQEREDPNRTTAVPIVALDPRWAVSFEAAPAAPPGFDQQLAYAPLKSGELVAINLDNGATLWRVELPTTFRPAAGDGLVFVAAGDEIVALDQGTGREVWTTPLGGPLSGGLHWDAGWLLASTNSGELVALDAVTGQVRWRAAMGSPLSIAPTASGDRLFAALADARIVALDFSDGHTIWTRALDQPATGLLALEDQLLAGTRGNRLHSLSLDDGGFRWSQRAAADIAGAPVADEEHIYFTALDNVLRALDRDTGSLAWRQNLPSRPRGGPLRIDTFVLVPLATTDLIAYRAESGEQAFSLRALSELGGPPFLRERPRPTAPRLITVSREGALQAFAPRIEPNMARLTMLPGRRVGG